MTIVETWPLTTWPLTTPNDYDLTIVETWPLTSNDLILTIVETWPLTIPLTIEAWPFIDLVLRIKIPTADEDKGLGTGETDVSFITEFSRRINADLFGLAELGYTWISDPSGGDLDNRLIYSVGLGYEAHAQWTLSGYLDGRTALVDGNDDPLSLLAVAEYKHRPDLRFDTMLELGLNDGSPDIGLTFGVRVRL